jgi:hypothetical protein
MRRDAQDAAGDATFGVSVHGISCELNTLQFAPDGSSPAIAPAERYEGGGEAGREEAPVMALAEARDMVAKELRLTPDLQPDELARIRRDFALRNHPDRVLPAYRELATRRMMAANALIDQALSARRTDRPA